MLRLVSGNANAVKQHMHVACYERNSKNFLEYRKEPPMKRCRILFKVFLFLIILTVRAIPVMGKGEFPSWKKKAPALVALREFVEGVTDKSLPGYVPPDDRIAVFDLDGTLMMETGPTSLNVLVGNERLGELGMSVEEGTGVAELLQIQAGAFAGMGLQDYIEYVRAYGRREVPGYSGLTYDRAFYQPMLEVVAYLEQKKFTVYICSGANRYLIRAITGDVLDIPPGQCIGTDLGLTYEGMGEEEILNPYLRGDARMILDGTISDINMMGYKSLMLMREIGQQPILVFGNSMVDFPMANYAMSQNPYPCAVFMVKCDDQVRERGSAESAAFIQENCEYFGWHSISMKDDWKTIYGEGVARNEG